MHVRIKARINRSWWTFSAEQWVCPVEALPYRSKHWGPEKGETCSKSHSLLVAKPTLKLRTCPPSSLPSDLGT